jgi:hypothetical protein
VRRKVWAGRASGDWKRTQPSCHSGRPDSRAYSRDQCRASVFLCVIVGWERQLRTGVEATRSSGRAFDPEVRWERDVEPPGAATGCLRAVKNIAHRLDERKDMPLMDRCEGETIEAVCAAFVAYRITAKSRTDGTAGIDRDSSRNRVVLATSPADDDASTQIPPLRVTCDLAAPRSSRRGIARSRGPLPPARRSA